jgi:FAD/FMN-containing dehydrogenase
MLRFARMGARSGEPPAPLSKEFLDRVSSEFPQGFLSQDPALLRTYGTDWTRFFEPCPGAVVFPRTTDQVSRFLALCSRCQVPVVPSGGRTGLSAGAVAARGEVVLSLERMNAIGEVDALSQTVRVQAGAVTEAVHRKCEPHGLLWPVDFASRGSSQVGGNISTNAGGLKVLRYGVCRQWVLGLQVVTMAGTVLELNGALEKNNTGPDLRQLFIGSEGTLGVITEATLKLTRLPGDTDVFFFGLPDMGAILRLFREMRAARFELQAFECLSRSCLKLVTAANPERRAPFDPVSEMYVVAELLRPDPVSGPSLDAWLQGAMDKGLFQDGALAQSPKQAREFWTLREDISETLSRTGLVHKNDVALPLAELEAFTSALQGVLARRSPGFETFLWGHIGDGNLHINSLKPPKMADPEFLSACRSADRELFELIRKHRGSVSAEHGIGLLKKYALPFSRSAEEIAFFRALKQVFDPQGLLNPGKILDQ